MNSPLQFSFSTQKGFTLLEFLVASALALLLSVAISSLYFYTSRLNHIAQTDLKVQEDLRQASQLISRDASLAGNFGCLSLGSLYQTDSRNTDDKFTREFHVFFNEVADNSPIVFDRPGNSAMSDNQNFGVNTILIKNLGIPGLAALNGQDDKALVFYYGTGSAGIKEINFGNSGSQIESISFIDGDIYKSLEAVANQGGYFALSSCQALNIFKINRDHKNLSFTSTDFGDVRISYEDETNKQKHSEINLLRYIVHAYVVGSFNGQPGLYRIELNENGIWGPPVLISEHVSKMDISFIYPTSLDANNKPVGCPSAFNDEVFDIPNNDLNKKFNHYSFYEKANTTFNNTSSSNNPKRAQGIDLSNVLPDEYFLAPAAVNVILTVNYPKLELPFGLGRTTNGRSNESSRINMNERNNEVPTQKFRIFSSIRGGNQCANRNLLD